MHHQPVAKQVFSDTAGSATRRTIASTPEHSTFYVSVTEFSAVWAYTPIARYRQEDAEEERQAKEAYTKDAEARYGPAATWPRLSETLDGPRHPRFCQSCGVERPPEASDEATPAWGDESDEGVTKANDKAKADDSFRLIKAALEPPPGVYGWQEHD